MQRTVSFKRDLTLLINNALVKGIRRSIYYFITVIIISIVNAVSAIT